MSRVLLHAAAAGAVFRRDLAVFTSYRMRFATTLLSTIVTVTLFFYVSRLVRSDLIGSADAYFAYVVVGIAVFAIVTSTLSLPIATLRAELLAGTFERMVVSPFGPVRSIASLMLFPLAVALATAAAAVTYAALAFGLDLEWPGALLAMPVALLAAIAFAPFGLLLTAVVVVVKQSNAGSALVITGVSLLAGIYFPVVLLPDGVRWAAEAQPFTPAVDLLRHVLIGTPMTESAGLAVLKLVAFAALLVPVASLALVAAVRRARRLGTLGEY